jgi:NAD(P)-dependent dehydrogenase (short-subunit alcohol dehydrogenase family)
MTSGPKILTALVTGASRGIGRAVARSLAHRGVRVAIHYQANARAARETLASLTGTGHALFAADLADPTAAVHLWNAVVEKFRRIDVLVNNAAIYEMHPPLSTGYPAWQAAWDRTITTNLLAPAHLSLLAAQAMAAGSEPHGAEWGRGRIVNISSRGAMRGEPDAPAYGASKAALNSMSQSLAKALAPQGVYVFSLAPGWVSTDMATAHITGPGGGEVLAQHPLGRIATPEEIAAATVFCALDAPAVMTGGIIDLNGASYLHS